MTKPRAILTSLRLAFTLATMHASAAQGPYALLHSLFDPGMNAQGDTQQGFSVAVEGNIAVVGVPGDATGGVVKVYDATSSRLLYMLTNPSPEAGDLFGWAVAISGTRVVVGAINDDTGAANAGSAYIYDLATSTPLVPAFTLLNPVPEIDDLFGVSVAISGARVVVGARNQDAATIEAGSAYVYDLASALPTVPVLMLANPSSATGAGFGNSVCISGTRVAVGASYDDTGATDAGIVYVYDLVSATPSTPAATLTNPIPVLGGRFGKSVAIDGTRLLIGANSSSNDNNTGSGYVYDLSSATPLAPVAVLTDPNHLEGTSFASSVAISGTRVVIGAYFYPNFTHGTGAAYFYDLANGAPFACLRMLYNPSPATGDNFGYSVAISGTRVVVGAYQDDTRATNAGSAYVYDFTTALPTLPVATLNQPSPASGDYFGYSVAVSGARLVIGAYRDDTGAADAGSAYVYDLAGSKPTVPVLTLHNPNPLPGANYGSAVAISGTYVVVGAPLDDTGAFDAGSAYVYDLAGATPTVPWRTLHNPSPAAEDRFGQAVAISGTRVVVGAYLDDAGANAAGSAYVYDLLSGTPTLPLLTLTNPSPAAGDGFGNAVAISGTRIVVGAYLDDTGASDAGSAYVYDVAGATPGLPTLTLSNPIPAASDRFGNAVAISGASVIVGAYEEDSGAQNAGSAYVYDLGGAAPAVPVATLHNPSPETNDWFGFSVAISGSRVVVGAHFDNAGASQSGSAYLYDLTSVTPALPVLTLTNPSPTIGEGFGCAVAIDVTTIAVGARGDDTGAPNRGAAYIYGSRPALSIASAAPGLATISWTPATSSEFVLQYTDDFAPTNWVAAPSGATNPITIPATNASRFYRLAQP